MKYFKDVARRCSHRKPTPQFLTAEWRDVLMLNYEVDPALLSGLVPSGTELDLWQGRSFISLIGFRFLDMKVLGVPIPFHRDFDEINLRLYVRRREGNEVKRGVAFIREIAPRRAVATIARVLYNEQYVTRPTSRRLDVNEGSREAHYSWAGRHDRGQLSISVSGDPALPAEGSLEQFIVEHYWGYSAQRAGGSLEYRVLHPPWRVWRAHEARFEGDVVELYGPELEAVLRREPASALLAEGSAIAVFRGQRLTESDGVLD
jgi:uncharacterized protein YqjF (DUF2071 family)